MLKIFSSGLNTAVVSEEYTVATQIAESLMAKTGIENVLEAGETSGIDQEKYYWRVSVENITNPELDEESEVNLMEVNVVVKWGGDGQHSRSIELITVKAGQQK